jgi:hypothetical protein
MVTPTRRPGRLRSAEGHRHAEALARSHRDVSAPVAGRRKQCQRQQIGGADHQRVFRMQRFGERAVVAHVAVRAGILQQDGETVALERAFGWADHDGDAERRGAGAHDVLRLRKHVGGDIEHAALALAHALAKRHGLGGRGGFVEH